ncbi:bifunctional phosphopantothenoylcysteine decarboxylase/phosphopantothenate--cysteine ligase CoaBC [Marinospirillum perlucidum]|uniref:bifunctional phosphopantothenoylcysteine decarboxylase/phosphopantothenate--cysteine ligase CoaBC n=1 Tax=Marinospirillum perlucidum TaxID=1982602 RepID=UPI000DF2D92E|nr:bifunctional phosphopantothenoylcysteine decarboxylase/phosphopantothenate--cysteine ligase CoaBC [Marinospirillum perlucidum]
MTGLANKRILLGISGGIAAYKSAYLARLLVKAGAEVRVVMTQGAKAFIQPLTFQALTGHPVHDTLLDEEAEAGMGHIELARWADEVIIAPATADLLARLAAGMADDLLTTLCLATEAPIHLAPAMNQRMWSHPATQSNLLRLQGFGYQVIPPGEGEQACGDLGQGRLPEPEDLFAYLEALTTKATPAKDQPARGLTLLLTAGPTREPLDPVRYLSNHSSGKMGFALAEAAAQLGARVILISGPVDLPTPEGVERINISSAQELLDECQKRLQETDIFIACAAVADYRAADQSEHKIKKTSANDELTLKLVKNPDILATVAASEPRPFCVGFAAETREVEEYARQKLIRKKLDAIVANDVSDSAIGFGSDDNQVTLLYRPIEKPLTDAPIERLPLDRASKKIISQQLLKEICNLYYSAQDAK